jgi:GIY-YIG catalytic domain-containing protein
MRTSQVILGQYARMWPREVFYRRIPKDKQRGAEKKNGRQPRLLFRTIDLLTKPGVYILYRDDVPYYVGQAKKLRGRLWKHACVPDSRYYNFWNFFSAFVVQDSRQRNEVERILIAAMPTANSAQPRIPRESLPAAVTKMIREIGVKHSNPDNL